MKTGNIILIGMPGVGKSTLGILLAKSLGYQFIDTDIILQNQKGRLLHEILSEEGIEKFIKIEETIIKSIICSDAVIATGGSVVLSDSAMDYLIKSGIVIYLDLDIETIIKRINNIQVRGIVKDTVQTLQDIHRIRIPLYKKYSNISINCNNKDQEQIVNEILKALC